MLLNDMLDRLYLPMLPLPRLDQRSNLEYLALDRRLTLTRVESHCTSECGRLCMSLAVGVFSSRGWESSLAMNYTRWRIAPKRPLFKAELAIVQTRFHCGGSGRLDPPT